VVLTAPATGCQFPSNWSEGHRCHKPLTVFTPSAGAGGPQEPPTPPPEGCQLPPKGRGT
jgi:hypothetical protein